MMGNRNVPFADASECVATSSMGGLLAAVPAKPFVVAAPAAAVVVVSCACMDMYELPVLVWTCIDYIWACMHCDICYICIWTSMD